MTNEELQRLSQDLSAMVLNSFYEYEMGLRNIVREKRMVPGNVTNFIDVSAAPQECVLAQYFSGDWIDGATSLLYNRDELNIQAVCLAAGLSDKANELIVTALQQATNSIDDHSTHLTDKLVDELCDRFDALKVPDDGRRWAILDIDSWKWVQGTWGAPGLAINTVVFEYKGIKWLLGHRYLPREGSQQTCLAFHSSAVGFAAGDKVITDINYHKDRKGHFVAASLCMGAALLNANGVIKINTKRGI